MKLELSRQILEEVSNIHLHQNPSSGSRVVPCGRTDSKRTYNEVFRNFAKAPYKRVNLRLGTHRAQRYVPLILYLANGCVKRADSPPEKTLFFETEATWVTEAT